MKTNSVIVLALVLWLAHSSFAQSSFALRNHFGGVDAPVFNAQGVPLAGADYRAELWGAATPDSLTPALVYGDGSREMVPFLSGGYFASPSGFLSVFSVPPNGWAWLRVRAWDARLGSTYEQVVALGVGGYGESSLFYAQGADPTLILPVTPAPLIGLQSFSLLPVVPEPSTWALLALGGAALCWTYRRRSHAGL